MKKQNTQIKIDRHKQTWKDKTKTNEDKQQQTGLDKYVLTIIDRHRLTQRNMDKFIQIQTNLIDID